MALTRIVAVIAVLTVSVIPSAAGVPDAAVETRLSGQTVRSGALSQSLADAPAAAVSANGLALALAGLAGFGFAIRKARG